MNPEKSAYEILNILQKASASEIKTAFTKQMVALMLDSKDVPASRSWFREVKQLIDAYETLALPEKAEQKPPAPQAPVENQTDDGSANTIEKGQKVTQDLPEEKKELMQSGAGEQAVTLEKINALLPEYFSAKRAYSEAGAALANAGKIQNSQKITVILKWAFLAGLLASMGWIFYNLYQGNANPFGPSKSQARMIQDSISKASQDSIAAITIDSSLIEPVSSFYEVTAPKAYFHSGPFEATRTIDALLKGYRLKASLKYENFYYTEFENRFNKRVIDGWISGEDIKPSGKK